MFKSLKTIVALAIATTALAGGAAQAQGATSFGADVEPDVQPSNSSQAHECNGFPNKKCTWVLNDAYGNPGHEKSPKTGTLKKIKLIAGEAGSFKLQLVKVEARPVRQGRHQRPEDHLRGSGRPERRHLQGRDVQGEHPRPQGRAARDRDQGDQHPALQLRRSTTRSSTTRCSRSATPSQGLGSDDGCWMLIEGIVK